ncbi:HNH endonuclease [Streptomyces orinoci]|uniref:HNH endonuclease n=1 Tax=Streptomyces orinoci TaxID=67339 RepID=A0ABV3K5M8_STRON|nr:HNH endonuclease [Streptomyces orinoci]
MSLHHAPHLNAARRRARKRSLARRDGAHCAYCRTPFTDDLRQATIDHIVPLSLFRTWRSENLVLACHPCNTTKAARLPLLMGLLLLASTDVEAALAPATMPDRTAPNGPFMTAFTGLRLADWRMLARLAYARESAVRPAFQSAGRAPESRADLPVRPRTGRLRERGEQPVYARTAARTDCPVRAVHPPARTASRPFEGGGGVNAMNRTHEHPPPGCEHWHRRGEHRPGKGAPQ